MIEIPVLDKGHVIFGDPMEDQLGTDVKPVNAARQSYGAFTPIMRPQDEKLTKFLCQHTHTSPFRHAAISFRIKVPLYIAAQWRTHMIASALQSEIHSFNEISARYTEVNEEFYEPMVWRSQAAKNKQASGEPLTWDIARELYLNQAEHDLNSMRLYRWALEKGAAREQARGYLPQNLYTAFMWTASLQAVAHFIELRESPHAQWEIQQYAKAVHTITEELFPVSIRELLAPKPPTDEQLTLLTDEQILSLAASRNLIPYTMDTELV